MIWACRFPVNIPIVFFKFPLYCYAVSLVCSLALSPPSLFLFLEKAGRGRGLERRRTDTELCPICWFTPQCLYQLELQAEIRVSHLCGRDLCLLPPRIQGYRKLEPDLQPRPSSRGCEGPRHNASYYAKWLPLNLNINIVYMYERIVLNIFTA